MKSRPFILLILTLTLTYVAEAQQKDETAIIHGRVTDLFGRGLEGATIQFFSRPGLKALNEISFVKSVTTDAQGNYILAGLPYGYYKASVELRGFRHSEVSLVFLSKGENVLDIGLEVGALIDIPAMEISGTVRQSDKSPVMNATVTLMSAFKSDVAYRTRTDKDGEYKFIVNTHSQYIIYASKPGFEASAATTTGEVRGKDLVLVLQNRQK